MEPLSPYLFYDEVCDLLGGASWDQAYEQWVGAGLAEEREKNLILLAPNFEASRQYLFSGDSGQVLPLEVLWLKWNLFLGLFRRIERFHREKKVPLLNLEPRKVRLIFHGPFNRFVPRRWTYSMVPQEDDGAVPVEKTDMPRELAGRLFQVPSDLQYLYSSPTIQGVPLGHEETITVLIRGLEQVRSKKQEVVRGLIEVHLVSDNLRPKETTEKDVFSVRFSLPDKTLQPIQLWLTKQGASDRGLLLKGVTDSISKLAWDLLIKSQKNVFSGSKVKIYKSYHVPCDLFSLGMILLRTLLVNDEQDMALVSDSAQRFLDGLEPVVSGLDPQDRRLLSRRLRFRLQDQGGWHGKAAILYRLSDRKADLESIPNDLWHDILTLAFQLLTWIPGFSFCKDHGDYSLDDPGSTIAKIAPIVDQIEERIRFELLGSGNRNREILEACDVIRAEWNPTGTA